MGEWYTLSDASRACGKRREYFTRKYREEPEIFEGVEIQTLAGIVFVSEKGLEILRTRAKKLGVHLIAQRIKWTTKQNAIFCFYPSVSLN